MTIPVRYLPTRKFHILPITGLSPDELKKSAKACSRDREKIGHNSLLNMLAKSMGFKGGFSGYKAAFESGLITFMEQHGLTQQTDLISPQHLPSVGLPNTQLTLKIEQLAGRLFHSKRSLPKHIFTGYNFRYDHRYDDVTYEYNQYGRPALGSAPFWQYIEEAKSSPLQKLASGRRLIDFVLGGHFFTELGPSFNLLGDLLVSPVQSQLTEPEIYWPQTMSVEEKQREQAAIKELGALFRAQLDISPEGWVEVLPFNNKLIFLKGSNGEYDFVLPELRSTSFEHRIYAPYLKRAEVPSLMNEEYHFKRWYYFEFSGWRDMVEHRAEQRFYAQEGTMPNYPGLDQVRKKYLLDQGAYQSLDKKLCQAPDCSIRFYPVQFANKKLYVSELITIADLARFANKQSGYMANREHLHNKQKIDRLDTMNQDAPGLPAATTWFDACAFMAAFENKYKCPVRLLSAEEYLAIRLQDAPDGQLPIAQIRDKETRCTSEYIHEDFLSFTDDAGNQYGEHPPFMAEDTFQQLVCRYNKPVQMIQHSTGLNFVDANNFAEWLYGNTGGKQAPYICSRTLCTFYATRNFARECFPANSTGKYKHMKIGFRMCFEAN